MFDDEIRHFLNRFERIFPGLFNDSCRFAVRERLCRHAAGFPSAGLFKCPLQLVIIAAFRSCKRTQAVGDREIDAARSSVTRLAEVAARAEEESRAAETAEAEARRQYRAMQAGFEAAREALASAERKAGDRLTRISALAEARTRLSSSFEETIAARSGADSARLALADSGNVEASL